MNVVCLVDECPDSKGRHPAPPQLVLVKESASAWVFKCRRCERDGRKTLRVATKNLVGGTFGSGQRDDGSGQGGGEGISRYVQGANLR